MNSPTEARNPRTLRIDELDTIEVLRLINAEDQRVPTAVAGTLEQLATAVDLAVAALRGGGRVHYFGAGSSGRIGFLDAAELRPTFDAPDGWFCAHQAGGTKALLRAVENAEDDFAAGETEATNCVSPGDVVIGLTASGRTPYVLGALGATRRQGGRPVLLTANPDAGRSAEVAAEIVIALDTGPEVIAGSTRMKAATAQKLALNAFSTAIMVRLGRVYSNLMVSMVATNAKLRARMVSILVEATGQDEQRCRAALQAADGELKPALVALLGGAGVPDARRVLEASEGRVREALALLSSVSEAHAS
ncbi:MAG TPA: N-acetylmuramic acid 6-phosphate etherase [Micromonosporaceae bacterium]|jgi:N-acetylmuramic acid 6-phosphate etherase|nr:N-acetylmuramic acid 6-phosphate etherase [Micromonosporaceae bacterium]